MKIDSRHHYRRALFLTSLALLPAIPLCRTASAAAVIDNFTATGGNWSVAGNWSAGVPGNVAANTYTVNIINTDGLSRTIVYDYAGTANITLLTISSNGSLTNTNTVLLNNANLTLITGSEFIGGFSGSTGNNTGAFTQSAGTHDLSTVAGTSGSFILGFNSGDKGTYTLSGGTFNFANTGAFETIGNNGTGTFIQTGGFASNNYGLIVGNNTIAGSTSSYQLSGSGVLQFSQMFLGLTSGNGTFSQSGGSVTGTSGGQILLAQSFGSNGTYTLSNGSLSLPGSAFNVNGGGNATVNQSGGTANISTLNLGGNHGVYNLSGSGSLTTTIEQIGNNGSGTFTQTGGTNTVNSLVLGSAVGTTGNYTLSAGSLNDSSYEVVGSSGNGTLTQTGGTNNTFGMNIAISPGSVGTCTISNGTFTVATSLLMGCNAIGSSTATLNINSGATVNVASLVVNAGSTVAINLNGGILSVTSLNLAGTPSALNWTSGTLNINSSVTWDSSAANTTTSNAFLGNLAVGANQTLLVTGTETIGGNGTFSLSLNAGATHYVTSSITLNPAGTLTESPSATLYTPSFTQAGGTINGFFQNQGSFTYQSGLFNAEFDNQGSLSFTNALTLAGGLLNENYLTLNPGQILTLNGIGLNNFGYLSLSGGTLAGSGPLLNEAGATFTGHGTLNSAFTNQGTLALSGVLTLNGAANVNDGTLSGSGSLLFSSNNFTNNADGIVAIAAANAINFRAPWTNAGLISLQGTGATIAGSLLTNTGTLQGAGTLSAPLNNNGILRPSGGELDLTGGLVNNAQIQIPANASLLITTAFPSNAGIIALAGGSFDTNNQPLSNPGTISGNGVIRTGGLTITSTGLLLLADLPSSVYGNITNNGNIKIVSNTTTFYGAVINNTNFTVTSGVARFLGNGVSMTIGGNYISDPSDNYFSGLATTPTGFISGGVGDRFFLTGNTTFTNAGTFSNAGSLSAADITNSGHFTQTGPFATTGNVTNSGALTLSGAQSWSTTSTLTNTAGTTSLLANAKLANITITGGTVDIASSKIVLEPTPAAKTATLLAIQTDAVNHSLTSTGLAPNLALAIIDNGSLLTPFSTFGGMPVDTNSILIAPELLGDANIDGHVDLNDLNTVLNHLGTTNTGWTWGGFDGQPTIDLNDLNAVLNHLGTTYANSSAAPATTAALLPATPTPEPTSLSLLLPLSPLLLRRRSQTIQSP